MSLSNNTNILGKYKIVEVTFNLCVIFLEEVLLEYFPRNYLNQYISICQRNPSPLLGYILVDIETNKMVAGVLARRQKSKGITNYENDVIYIEMLATKSQFTRQGLAKDLLEEIGDLGSDMGVKRIELHVSISNAAAINFYYKNGFKMETKEKDFYRNVKDYQGSKIALLLVKNLTGT